jgi:hypothetical protein
MILLSHNNCTGGCLVIFTYVNKIYLSWIYPLHHSLSSSSPFLRTIWKRFRSSVFIYEYVTHPPYKHSFSLPHAHLSPTSTYSWKRFLFYFCPSFFLFYCTGVWTQDLHLEPLHQPFFVKCFFEIGSHGLFA